MTKREAYKVLQLERELARRRARTSLRSFTKFTKADYILNWHHVLLCQYLDKFVRGEITRLMVFMPPQHGKSELVSRRLPAYILGLEPDTRIVGASYSPLLSQSFNRDVQRIIDSREYSALFPDTYLNKSNVRNDSKGSFLRNVDIFEVVGKKGYYKSVGVGGALTGSSVDVGIIDDPIKDNLEASSYTYRQRVWNWYTDVFKTRLHNDSKVLLTQTRWHEDDLSGRILDKIKKGAEEWTILTLPAIKESILNPEDPRKIGEALWPERHSLKKIEEIRTISPRTFASLYQQDPKPVQVGGEYYKNFKTELHTDDVRYDPSKALHITFDFNVLPYVTLCVWQIDGDNAYQIEEILGEPPYNKTAEVCKLFKDRYPVESNAGLFIYGDPSGRHKDTRSEQGYNDYDIIYNELKEYHPSERVLSSAPPLALRGAWINEILAGARAPSIVIDRSCIQTINDYLYVKETAEGGKLKEKAKNEAGATYETVGHTSDANDYFLASAFDYDYDDYKSGSRDINPIIRTARDSPKRY